MKFKKKKLLPIILLIPVMVLAVFAVFFKLYTGNYYGADQENIEIIKEKIGDNVHAYGDKNGMVFLPTDEEFKAVIVFYPGGKVEYTAYSGLMYELADRGFICLLPRMPENLAVLRINAADVITKNYKEDVSSVKNLDWYLAGHSLGGVAACSFLSSHIDEYKGAILCASFPAVDFSDKDIRLLSIYGSNDGVLKMDKYNDSKPKWPKESYEYVIDGGIHSYFGSYGIQEGDGEPSISNEKQILETADIISSFLSY